jgi:tol-pal system protein YbgF
MVNSQSLLQMLERLDSLQQEMAQLRGQLEEQQHTIEGLKSRQRELYLDIDRRISRIEREGAAPAAAVPTPPLTGGDAGAANSTATAPVQPEEDTERRMQQEREAYQKAFDMLRELRYAQATAAFREFLKSYPKGRYAHIAQYWLGEAGYAQRDFRQAITDYNALLVNFPESPKLAEAMLKMGYSYYELKEPDQARKILEQLLQQYPDSTEAGQARNLLKRIDKNAG